MPEPLKRGGNTIAAVASLLVACIGLLAWFEFDHADQARRWVRHTYDVVATIDALEQALSDAETGQRGFLLTGQDRYLLPYDRARDRVALLQGELGRLVVDNRSQQDRLRTLAPLAGRKMEELAETIQLYRQAGPDAAAALVRSDIGQALMEQIRAVLDRMRREENDLLAERQRTSLSTQRTARTLALAGAAVALLALALALRTLARSQAKLARSETQQRLLAGQMRTAFESISQGLAVFDAEYRLLQSNDCFRVLLGLQPQRLQPGQRYDAVAGEAIGASDGPFLETEDQIRHGRSGGANEPIVYERTRATDARSFELRRTRTPDGGFVLTVTDVSERVRAEASARTTHRLQAVGQLTGGIAHDFNNLLTVILGNLELAQRKLEDGSPILPMVDRGIWAAKRGAKLTHQLLAFARKQPLVPASVDLSAMLPDLASLLRRTLGEHIAVQIIDTAGLWSAMADLAQVENAVLNLALNAGDAMPGGGALTIELANKFLDADYAAAHAEVSPGDYVMLAVSDTGTGMSTDVLARAFEPFFTTKGAGQGTGLGLAMVFGFVKQSGGHVKIYSELGEGTTVRVYLPRAAVPAPAGSQRAAAPVELPRGSGTVLVVEDEATVREVAVTVLRDLGYRVLESADGPEALRTFAANEAKVDLLLCDVMLPGGMRGNEVARRLQEIQPTLPALFMSGYTENAIVHNGRLDDGVALIGKPFSREMLARKVAETIARSRLSPDKSSVGQGQGPRSDHV